MLFHMAQLMQLKDQFQASIADLRSKAFLRDSDWKMVEKKIKDVDEQFLSTCQELGYRSDKEFMKTAGKALGVTAALGATGMLVHVCVTSTSTWAALTGAGSWANISAGATAGFTTAGIGFAVMGVGFAVWAIARWLLSEGDEVSNELATMFMEDLDKLTTAHTGAFEHLKKLSAIKTILTSMKINSRD